jgi:hypothetical protein
MRSNWKTLAVGFIVVLSLGWICAGEAAAQFTQQPVVNPVRNPSPYGQAMQRQPGAMQRQAGMMQQQGVMQQQPGMMQQQPGAMQGHTAATPKSSETYCIVEVAKELQVVSKPKGLKDLKKRLDDEFKSATKAYQDAKKDKANKGVTLEKPEKKTVKELKSGIKTQDKAQEELQKMQAEREKSGGKTSTR